MNHGNAHHTIFSFTKGVFGFFTLSRFILKIKQANDHRQIIFHTVLNFGKKHYGKKLEDVPKDYVDWMLRECKNLDPDLRAALVAL